MARFDSKKNTIQGTPQLTVKNPLLGFSQTTNSTKEKLSKNSNELWIQVKNLPANFNDKQKEILLSRWGPSVLSYQTPFGRNSNSKKKV